MRSNPPICYTKEEVAKAIEQVGHRLSPQPDNSHYTSGIEPWDYIRANELNFFEGNVVKYVTRWRKKNGLDDLRKAKVYIEELIRQEEATCPSPPS